MRLTLASMLIALSVMLGCSEDRPKPGRNARGTGDWETTNRMNGSVWDWDYLNFYEYYRKYPTYGIALYTCNSAEETDYSEQDFVADSLRLCRDGFMKRYQNGAIMHTNSSEGFPWKLEELEIAYVVVLLCDRNPKKDVQVGGVFAASDVFDPDVDLKQLAKDGLQRGVLNKDDPLTPSEEANGYSPNEKARYQIIERHMAERGIRYIPPPKKPRTPGVADH